MSDSKADNTETTDIEETAAKKPAAKKTAAKKATVAKKPKATKKVAEKIEVEAKTDDVVIKEADSSITAADESKEDMSAAKSTYYAIAASVLIAVIFSIVTVATFFQDEVDSVVASISSSFDSEVAVEETTPVVAPVAQVNAAPYGYQTQPSQNMSFDEVRQQQRAAYEESVRQHNARIEEMNKLRTASFETMEQDRIERMNRFETMRTKTQAIQQEMQQKMQAAYDEFHAI